MMNVICLSLASLLVSVSLLVSNTSQAQVAVTPEFVPGEVLIKLKGRSAAVQSQAFVGRMVTVRGMRIKGSFSGLNMHHVQLKIGEKVDDALRDLRNDPQVEFAEPNYIIKRMDEPIVGQPQEKISMADFQAAAGGTVGTLAQITAPIGASQAWSSLTPNKAPVTVAVIDTGIDYNHSVFVATNAIWTNPGEIPGNGIDDDHNGFIDDVHGWNFVSNNGLPLDDDDHGTHVAGIILGTTQDITAGTLQPSKVKLMAIKFLDATGSGTTADAIKGIYYAVNNGARVLNNSWGGGGYSQSLLDAIVYAYDHSAVFTAAAGNSASNNDVNPTYPANYSVPSLISVAATTDTDLFASSFSNYGSSMVHVGSPGQSIWSTFPGNLFGRLTGTSMATPFVSGVAALAIYEKPSMLGYQAKQLVLSGAQVISSLNTRVSSRARINVNNTVLAAQAASVSASQPVYVASGVRDLASVSTPAAGCGMVSKMSGEEEESGGPSGWLGRAVLFLALVAPLALTYVLRQSSAQKRRQHTRYKISSQVRVMVGDKEMVGEVSSISLGGVQLNTDAWLEKGGVVSMSISSPDGKDQINVAGQVVWSEEHKRYGVAFAGAENSTLSTIRGWTRGLMKAS
jgi:subtilisin family serine protease